MRKLLYGLFLFFPVCLVKAGSHDKLEVKSSPTGIYKSCLDTYYIDNYWEDSYSYKNHQTLRYEVSLINNSDSAVSFWNMTGWWIANWEVNSDTFRLLDPYCMGSRNFQTRETIKAHGVKKFKITVKTTALVSPESIRKLKFGFYFFDGAKESGRMQCDAWHNWQMGNEEDLEELSKALNSNHPGAYEEFIGRFELRRFIRNEAWKRKQVIWEE